MKRIYLLIVALSCYQIACGQYQQPFKLYMYDLKTINPAFTGLDNEQTFNLQHADQWAGTRGHPASSLISYSNRLNKINSGVGFIFWNDQIGIYTNSNVSLLYNYQFKFGTKSKLVVGTELSNKKQMFDYSRLVLADPTDPIFGVETKSKFDVDIGMLYKLCNFSIAANAKNIFQSKYASASGLGNVYVERNYNVYTDYEFKIHKNFAITPSAFIQANSEYWLIGLNGNMKILNLILLGLSHRFNDDYSQNIYMAGVSIKDRVQLLALVYSNFNNTSFKPYQDNVEIMLRIKIQKKQLATLP